MVTSCRYDALVPTCHAWNKILSCCQRRKVSRAAYRRNMPANNTASSARLTSITSRYLISLINNLTLLQSSPRYSYRHTVLTSSHTTTVSFPNSRLVAFSPSLFAMYVQLRLQLRTQAIKNPSLRGLAHFPFPISRFPYSVFKR